jgi:DNA-binding CsgD family transcriptional regulator
MADRRGATRGRIVGRDRELELLREAERLAGDGAPQTVLVTGEAGIGKTRLVEELTATASSTVLVGGCVPVVGEALPFGPVVQAMRDVVRDGSPLEVGLPDDLVRLLPSAATRRYDAPGASALDAPVSATAQVRLFEAVLTFLGRLDHVTLVLEDLHWADRSTLDLVAFLARNLRRERVLLVLTLRSDDIGPDTPFRIWLAELERLSTVDRVDLNRLPPDDTTRMLAGLLGTAPTPALVDRIYQRSAGNPLFTEHLLSLGDDPQGPPPPTLRELLGSRFATLSEPTRRAVRLASVLGRVVDLELLAAVAEGSEAAVEESLREAVDRHLMEPRASGDYGFIHPLFREVVYVDLLPGERRRMHAAAARALSRVDDGSHAIAGEIARHWQAAGDCPRAFESAAAAGLAAEAVYAFADADEHLARAVDLGRELPDEAFDPLPVDRVELLAHAAQVANLVGHGDRAVHAIRAAIPLADDPMRRAQLLEREGGYHFNTGEFEAADAAYRAALELLPTAPELDSTGAIQARVYAGLGMLAMAASKLDAGAEACRRAIEIAAPIGQVRVEGMALNALGVVTAYGGDFDSGIARLRRSLTIAADLDEPDDLGAAYIHLTHVLGLAGRFDEAVRFGREGIDELRRVGLVRQYGSFLQANIAEPLIKAGRLPEAAALLDQALALQPQGLQAHPILVQCARYALVTGDLTAARERIEQGMVFAAEGSVPDAWRRELLEAGAELALWRHRPDRAAQLVEEGLALVECGDEERFAGPLVGLGLRAAADAADDARARRAARAEAVAVDRGRAIVERARALRPDPLSVDDAWAPDGPALAMTALAERARLSGRPDPDRWAEAAEAWERVGRPYPAAYARWREADATARSSHRTDRRLAVARHAYEVAVRLGATAIVNEVTELARWYRLDLTTAEPEPVPTGGSAESASSTGPAESAESAETAAGEQTAAAIEQIGLTPRELEVLAGLAAGQTNRELAETLYISVKTASVHVSNILRKLDVDGRAEAARVAYRLGLDRRS